ncbi:MAG: hypothetical protein ACYC1L_10110, partial [Alphaproteobacteria bacterium]
PAMGHAATYRGLRGMAHCSSCADAENQPPDSSRHWMKVGGNVICLTAKRIVVLLCASKRTIDLLHNGAGGYRAQFYSGVSCGERANRYIIRKLKSKIGTLCLEANIRTCPSSFVSASLEDEDTKVWIHQGVWLRAKSHTDRNLLVPRWKKNARLLKPCRTKLAVWATLTPANETRIEIKGGSVDKESLESVGLRLKPNRSRELSAVGFT